MKTRWPIVGLGELLREVKRMELVDPTKEYRLLGVRLEGLGPFHRETLLGSQSSATALRGVETGDFIYSRLFAWRGAFGVIPPQLDGCFVSNEFPTFVPRDERVDVDFLRYWFRLPGTLRRVEADCTGSTPLTRNRYKERFFLSLKIPLPTLEEQHRIVAEFARVDSAKALQAEARAELRILEAIVIDRAFRGEL